MFKLQPPIIVPLLWVQHGLSASLILKHLVSIIPLRPVILLFTLQRSFLPGSKLTSLFFISVPSVYTSAGGKAVRDPTLRRRARAPAKRLFTSSGTVGGLGWALNESSAVQGSGSFGFWHQTNTLMVQKGVKTEPKVETTKVMVTKEPKH